MFASLGRREDYSFGCFGCCVVNVFVVSEFNIIVLYSAGSRMKSKLSMRLFDLRVACACMSEVYMLKSVGEKTPPCGTPVLN